MASKKTKSTTPTKSIFNQKSKFDIRKVVMIALVLVIAIGYLLVRLSRASTTENSGSTSNAANKDAAKPTGPYMLSGNPSGSTAVSRPSSGAAAQIKVIDTKTERYGGYVINVTYALRSNIASHRISDLALSGSPAGFSDLQSMSLRGNLVKSFTLPADGDYKFDIKFKYNGKTESASVVYKYKKTTFVAPDGVVGGAVGKPLNEAAK